MSIVADSNVGRYAVEGTDIRDLERGRRARFVHAEAAQLGAEWLNGSDATPDDYEWVDDGPSVTDVVRAAEILGFKPSELIGAIEPLLFARWKQERALRRNPDVTAELMERDA